MSKDILTQVLRFQSELDKEDVEIFLYDETDYEDDYDYDDEEHEYIWESEK